MASKRHLRRRSCEGKRKYATSVEAAQAMHGTKIRTNDRTFWSNYQCKFCGGWHIGHAGTRVKQSALAKRRNAERLT